MPEVPPESVSVHPDEDWTAERAPGSLHPFPAALHWPQPQMHLKREGKLGSEAARGPQPPLSRSPHFLPDLTWTPTLRPSSRGGLGLLTSTPGHCQPLCLFQLNLLS